MSAYIKYLLTLLLVISFHMPSHGQCPGATSCQGASVYCAADALNGLTCNLDALNTSFPNTTLCNGTGTPNRVAWWAFVGSGGPLEVVINYDLGNCQNGTGLQAGIFEDNCSGVQVWDCDASCGNPFVSLSGTTFKCGVYYLWVDGCQGDNCTFTISISGNGGPPRMFRPLPGIHLDPGPQPCAGGTADLCWPGLPSECDPTLEWFRDGVKIQTNGYCAEDLYFPDETPSEICLRATVGNPDIPSTICDQDMTCLTITPVIQEHIGAYRAVCTRTEPFVWHGMPITSSCINPPCTARTESRNGCIVDSIVPILIIPPEARTGPLLEIPPSRQPFTWHGTRIQNSCINPPCSVRLEVPNTGCLIDSIRPIRLLSFPPGFGLIHGTVYFDLNNDCQFNANELPMEGIRIDLDGLNNTFQTLTDSNGEYSVLVPFDFYSVEAYNSGNQTYGCPISRSVAINDQSTTGMADFFMPDSNCYSGRLTWLPLTGRNRLRCDRQKRYIDLRVLNISRDTLQKDTVVLTIDSLMEWDRARTVPYDKKGPRELWVQVPELLPGQSTEIRIFFLADCGLADENEEVCFKAKYLQEYLCNDQLIAAELCEVIRNSRDPNDLTVTPFGFTDQRYISRDDVLTGLIRFHNTGSDTAYDVSVDLEFPEVMVDGSSIRFLGSSFPGTVMAIDSSVLHFRLDNIDLPHDDVDTVNSHGYILYSLEPTQAIPDWTVIDQQAKIYFDLNTAVPTNIEFQTIAGEYIRRNEELVTCEGDTILDITIEGDTTIRDTIFRNGPDMIITYFVVAHPSYQHEIDTLILAGDEIHGIRIVSDTSISFEWMTRFGCDSTVTYHVEASTTGQQDLTKHVYLYPNPNDKGVVYISGAINGAGRIELITQTGAVISEELKGTATRYFNVGHLPHGVYIYHLSDKTGVIQTGRLVIGRSD